MNRSNDGRTRGEEKKNQKDVYKKLSFQAVYTLILFLNFLIKKNFFRIEKRFDWFGEKKKRKKENKKEV